MTATQRSILDVLDQPHNLDQIAAATDLPIQNVQADLSLMQIRGAIEKLARPTNVSADPILRGLLECPIDERVKKCCLFTI